MSFTTTLSLLNMSPSACCRVCCVGQASSSAPSNPFGNAAPRDEAAYQAKKAAERAARAEERKKEPEEKKKSAAEKPDVPSGNWRDNAKPVEPSGGGRGGGERGGPGGGRGGAAAGRGGGDRERTKDGPPRERDGPPRERAPAEKKAEVKPVKAPPVKAPEAPKPEPKKPGKVQAFCTFLAPLVLLTPWCRACICEQ